MKISKESWFQIGIASISVIMSALVPELRSILFNIGKNIPVLLIIVGILAIFYLQAKKMVNKTRKPTEETNQFEQRLAATQIEWQKQHEEKLKKQNERIEHQTALLDKLLKTNTLLLSLTRSVTLPLIYQQHKEEVIKKMYYNIIQITALQEHQFEGPMITEYQKFYHQKEVERYSS